MRHAKVKLGLAGAAAVAAGTAWLLWATPIPPRPSAAPVSTPVMQEPAGQQGSATVQSQTVAQPAETHTASVIFEARFKASRERPRSPPDPAILNAPTFAEAFQAMKRAEGLPAPEAAAANPFGATR
jgi:hypothetical protein